MKPAKKKCDGYSSLFDKEPTPLWEVAQRKWLATHDGKYKERVSKLPIDEDLKAELNHLLNIDDHWHGYVEWHERNPEIIKRHIQRIRDRYAEKKEHAKKFPLRKQLKEMKNGLESPWIGVKGADVAYCDSRNILVRIKTAEASLKAAHETYCTSMGICISAQNKNLRDMFWLYYTAKLESFFLLLYDRDGDSLGITENSVSDFRKTIIQQYIFKDKTIRWNRRNEPTDITGKANEWLKDIHSCDFDIEGYLKKERTRMARIYKSEQYIPLKKSRLAKLEYLNALLAKEGIIGNYQHCDPYAE